MLPAITEWLNGPWAGKTMWCLRILFFASFIVSALSLVLRGDDTLGRRGGGQRHFTLLALLFSAGFLAVFAFQVHWQVFGPRNVDFMRFMRRHSHRPGMEVRRGSILDRNGSVLACDDPAVDTPGHRRYPLGAEAAHVVGYYDPRFGITGIEKAADLELMGGGTASKEDLAKLGRDLVGGRPAEGRDVLLTLDARLQRKAAALLAGRRGAVVALLPATGEILVLHSAPGFDPVRPGGDYGDAEAAPFLNRAVQGRYPAGSTFKVAMSAMAADCRHAPRLDCPAAGFRADRDAKPIRDVEFYEYQRAGKVWKGFGKIGLRDALVHSSNVYFAQLGTQISAKTFNAYVGLLGITNSLVLYQGAAGTLAMSPGGIPVVADADRKARAQLAIGQGKMMVSPLHVAMWTSAVANGGVLAPPHLERERPEGAAKPWRVFGKAPAETVGAMMREVVTQGTGRKAEIPGAGICGKTGTAQAPKGADHSWFTCFTSETQPRIVVTVLVEHGGFGARAALPVARDLVEEALRLGIVRSKTWQPPAPAAGGAK